MGDMMNIYQRIVLIVGAIGVFYVVFLMNPVRDISTEEYNYMIMDPYFHVIFRLIGVVAVTVLLYFVFSEGNVRKSLQKKLW